MNPMMQLGGGPQMAPQIPPPQQPTPEQMAMLGQPSWEEVISLMRDNAHRNYRIDIETDSTIAGSLESDMQGLSEIMQAVSSFMNQAQPLIQSGMLPMDAAKEILMTITRRARMGNAVEDALDKMSAPQPRPPAPDPAVQVQQLKNQDAAQRFQAEQAAEQQQKQFDLYIEQQRMEMDARFKDMESQRAMAVEQHEQQMQAQQVAAQNQLEAQRLQMESQAQRQLEMLRIASEERLAAQAQQIELLIARMNNAARVEVAEVTQAGQLQRQQVAAANTAAQDMSIQGLPDQPIQPTQPNPNQL